MARDVQAFTVSVPVGGTAVAPQIFNMIMPARRVTNIEIVIPDGNRGQLFFALGANGTAVLPSNAGGYIIGNDEVIHWPVEGYISSGAWQLLAYNTGTLPHSLQIRFLLQLPWETPGQVVRTFIGPGQLGPEGVEPPSGIETPVGVEPPVSGLPPTTAPPPTALPPPSGLPPVTLPPTGAPPPVTLPPPITAPPSGPPIETPAPPLPTVIRGGVDGYLTYGLFKSPAGADEISWIGYGFFAGDIVNVTLGGAGMGYTFAAADGRAYSTRSLPYALRSGTYTLEMHDQHGRDISVSIPLTIPLPVSTPGVPAPPPTTVPPPTTAPPPVSVPPPTQAPPPTQVPPPTTTPPPAQAPPVPAISLSAAFGSATSVITVHASGLPAYTSATLYFGNIAYDTALTDGSGNVVLQFWPSRYFGAPPGQYPVYVTAGLARTPTVTFTVQ